jgi:Domain of unknown function (DUF4349)
MLSTIRSGRRRPAFLAAAVISIVVAACGGAASTAPGDARSGVVAAPAATSAPAAFGGDGTGSTDGSNGDPAVYAAGQQDLLIIKNGTMTLQVAGIDAALASATQQIRALGGYASGSDRSGDGESDQATITFRIPAARWDDALTALRALGTKVLAEHSTTDDVTGQVVDLEARIKNLKATEQALQAIMDRATDIKDVLAVQDQLTTVRGQIEEMTGQQTHLVEQAAMSTLAVTFSLKPDPVLTSKSQFDPKTEVDQASASLVGVLQGLATAGIWFGIVWLPILLFLAIIGLVGVVVARRVRRSIAPPIAPSEPAA